MTDQTPSPQSVVVPVEARECARLLVQELTPDQGQSAGRAFGLAVSLQAMLVAALSPEAPAREGDESFDNVEARAEAWSDRAEIQRMVEATTGVFAKWSSPEILSRFRQQFMAVVQQAYIEGYDAALTPRHEAPAEDGPVFHMNLLSHEDNEAWLESARRVAAKHEAPAEGAGEQERLADAYIAGALSVHEYWTENPGEAPSGDPEFDEAAGDYAYFTLADLRARSSAPEA